MEDELINIPKDSVDYNYLLKFLNTTILETTNQNLINDNIAMKLLVPV